MSEWRTVYHVTFNRPSLAASNMNKLEHLVQNWSRIHPMLTQKDINSVYRGAVKFLISKSKHDSKSHFCTVKKCKYVMTSCDVSRWVKHFEHEGLHLHTLSGDMKIFFKDAKIAILEMKKAKAGGKVEARRFSPRSAKKRRLHD